MQFTPHLKHWILSPKFEQKKFNLSKFYNDGFCNDAYNNLHELAVYWFKNLAPQQRLYALDWQHTCYSFNPNLPFEKDEFDEWYVSVFANGDYIFFLTEDFKNGLFCDGINLTISLFGKELLALCQAKTPVMFVDTEVAQ